VNIKYKSGTPFAGCTQIDECIRYKCKDNYLMGCIDGINVRTCYCLPGTEEGNTPQGKSELIVGSNPSELTCKDEHGCTKYGCGLDLSGQQISCIEKTVNTRECSCPDFLAGSAILTGKEEFRGCAVLIKIKSSTTLGYTLSNGYWNDWDDILVANLTDHPQKGYEDIWYTTKSSHEIGWLKNARVATDNLAPFAWSKVYPPVGVKNPGVRLCRTPTAYPDYPRSLSIRTMAVVCLNENTNLVAYTWNSESGNFDAEPSILIKDFGVTLPPPKKRSISGITLVRTVTHDFDHDGNPDFFMLDQDGELTLILTKHSATSVNGQIVPLVFSPPLHDITISNPLLFDLDQDGDMDFLFAASDAAHLSFYWYYNTYVNPGDTLPDDFETAVRIGAFIRVGSLSAAPSIPASIVANNFDNDPHIDLIMTTSSCYEMFFLPQVVNLTKFSPLGVVDPLSVKIFDGNCATCGCGTSGGVVAGDINQDGAMDLVNFLTGGVEILINNNKSGFVPQKVLGGADTGILYDMSYSGTLGVVAVASGITTWYELAAPNLCELNLDNCNKTKPNTICQDNSWKGFLCHCPTELGTFASSGDLCLDVDECEGDANGGCNHICNNTVGGYDCLCYPGYLLLSDRRTCQNLNECQDANTCSRTNGGCSDIDGSFSCFCDAGFKFANTTYTTFQNNTIPGLYPGHLCEDIDECASVLINECDQICENTVGSYTCACRPGYNPVYNELLQRNSDCVLIPCIWNAWNPWSTCTCGKETSRLRSQNTQASANSILCGNSSEATSERDFCPITTYCKQAIDPTTVAAALGLLKNAFRPDTYFPWVFPALTPVSVNFTITGFFIIRTNSTNEQLVRKAATIIHTEIAYLLGISETLLSPVISIAGQTPITLTSNKRDVQDQSRTTITYDINSAYPPNYIAIIVGVVVGVIAGAITICIWYMFYARMKWKAQTKDLRHLPKSCTIHFRQCISAPGKWERVQEDPPVYKKKLTGEKDMKFVTNIFEALDGEGIGIKEIWAVYNPMLVSSLGLTREKFLQRTDKSHDVFFKEKWKTQEESERRKTKREWTKKIS